MMYKEKSGAKGQWKALALVPMFALALGVVSIPAVRATVATISRSEVSVGKVNENNANESSTVKIFKVTDISSDGEVTTIVIKGENVGNNLSVSGAVLTINDKNYGSNAMECNMVDGKAVIITKYPVSETLEKSSMTLLINGMKVPFNLDNYLNGISTATAVDTAVVSSANNASTVSKANTLSVYGDMKVYLNGKEISKDELKNIPSSNIETITVDKKENALKIISK